MNDSIKVIDNDVEVITLNLIREITDYQRWGCKYCCPDR